MNGIENYLGFVVAGILLNITPGVDTIYILTRSISQGKKAGILSVLGIGTGALVHISFAAFGLSVILTTSAIVFSIIKYVGAAYLIYIGITTLISKSGNFELNSEKPKTVSFFKIYRQGFLTNLLNPKVALFFLSFLPQFVNPEYANGPIPFLILGFTFFTTGTIWCFFLAFSASFMTKTFRKNEKASRWLQKTCGSIFILLGLKLAFQK